MDYLSRDVGALEASHYGERLRRRWSLVVLGALLGLGLALVYTALQPRTYSSTASVLVSPTGVQQAAQEALGRNAEVNLDDEVQIVRSAAVAELATDLLRSPESAQTLASRVSVTVPPNTRVMSISYDAPTPQQAQQGAHAFAQAYLENRAAAAEADIDNQKQALRGQIDDLEASLEEAAGTAAALPDNSPAAAFADAQRSVLVSQITNLRAKLSPLQTSDLSPGEIINDARLPESPARPIIPLNLASGTLLGLLLGLAAAILVDRSDRRVRRGRDLERRFNVPVLVEVPHSGRRRLSGLAAPTTPEGAAFSQLRNQLVSQLPPGRRAVLVTGAGDGAVNGTVAANLAAALSRAGHDVLLLGADARSPAFRAVGVTEGRGLAALLLHEAMPADVEQRASSPTGMRAIPPGPEFPGAEDQLQTARMASVVAQLREQADYVVVDSPPTSTGAEAQALAGMVDAVLVVVEAERTTEGQVDEALRQLRQMGATVLGVVMSPPAVPPEVPGPAVSGGRTGRGEPSARPQGAGQGSTASDVAQPAPGLSRRR